MQKHTGANIQDMKSQNQMLILKLISTNKYISRVDLARMTGLSKMTIGNIATELIACKIVEETEVLPKYNASANYGRRPIMLTLSDYSPCICGMLIKRGLCQVILSSLDGTIFEQIDHEYTSLSGEQELIHILTNSFNQLKDRTTRRILAVGISSLGPLDFINGTLLKPPYFYGIENLPIVSIIEKNTSLPTYIVNDANAGALAEKLYGAGKVMSNFIYLHIMNGIGAGLVFDHKLYNGDFGQSGEIGHTSINFSGPKCVCGNTGCLDLYANVDSMRIRIRELAGLYPHSPLISLPMPSWHDIVDAGNSYDSLGLLVLEEFCSYISYSLVDTLNLLDISNIIVGYNANTKGTVIEDILQGKLSNSALFAKCRNITLLRSFFSGKAPLVGSIGLVADKIFSSQLKLKELDHSEQ